MRVRQIALLVLPTILVACADAASSPTADGADAPKFRAVRAEDGAEPIDGQYIVVMREELPEAAADAAEEASEAPVVARFRGRMRGFAARMNAGRARAIAARSDVAYVEQDQMMYPDATQSPATWGIDRIDQRNLPLNNSYSYTNTGSGVHAYIIDTGILGGHAEFTGRVGASQDFVGDGRTALQDCNGHGTHVSGTVGGTTYGVAKQVTLHAARVFSCSGGSANSTIINAVNWVAANAIKPAVANMSLGGGASQALDDAVTAAINSGVTFAVAAGNSNRDACGYSPARAPAAITVGATTSTDARASYSNYGRCLDIFAPGSAITSAWYTSTSATNTISGTSMATPHVAGVAALYLQGNPTASAATVRNALVSNGTTGVVGSAGRRSPNVFLFSNY
jgi:subtilisin family serine protease